MGKRGRKKGEKSKRRLEMGEKGWIEYQKEKERIKKEKWYYNPENRKKSVKRVGAYRANNKRKLIEYKGGKCVRCGYDKDIAGVYDFHHIDPSEKDFNISKKIHSNINVLKKEVDKCMLVCRNCHAEIHHELRMQA